MSDKKKKDEVTLTGAEKVEGKLNNVLADNRKIFIILGCVIVLVVVLLVILNSVNAKNLENQFDQIDQLQTKYTEVIAMDTTSEEYKTSLQELKDNLTGMSKGKKYPALKAQYLLASIAFEEKDYQVALDGFYGVYQKANGSYLGSLSLLNAAVCAEEKGDDSLALEYYSKVWDEFGAEAAESPKALFNQARLVQKGGDNTLAKATYQQLIDQFPQSEYAKLAKTVIVSL